MAKNKYDKLAEKLLECVGGKDNIETITHCITRVRFNLKDQSLVDEERIKNLPDVLGTRWSNNQLQVIVGQVVADVYEAVCNKAEFDQEKQVNMKLDNDDILKEKTSKAKFKPTKILNAFVGCLAPILKIFVGCGLIRTIAVIGRFSGLMDIEGMSYQVLNFVGNAGFYFLPIFIGASTAIYFKANVGLGMVIGGILIHPSFIELVASGESISLFGLPIPAYSYASTIIPAILSVFVMSKVQRFFAKYSPAILRGMLEPFGTLLVSVPLTLCVIAPIGNTISGYISLAVNWANNTAGFIALPIISVLFPLLVITGLHGTIAFSVCVNNIVANGICPILPVLIFHNLNQGAASLAVAFRTKNAELRSQALSCAVTVIVGAISEPAIFGVNLPLKTPFICVLIGQGVAGLISAILKVVCFSIPGNTGVLGLISCIDGSNNFIYMIIATIAGVVTTFITTLIMYKPATEDNGVVEKLEKGVA